ncbi:MAG: hypothetical protein ACKPBU_08320 [Alphaproteobacteria bacterium]
MEGGRRLRRHPDGRGASPAARRRARRRPARLRFGRAGRPGAARLGDRARTRPERARGARRRVGRGDRRQVLRAGRSLAGCPGPQGGRDARDRARRTRVGSPGPGARREPRHRHGAGARPRRRRGDAPGRQRDRRCTLLGLARLLLGTSDPGEIDRLAVRGSPAACDLLVGDILGGGIGSVPADATAAHFGRVGRGVAAEFDRADVAAALVNLVAQSILRLAFEAALHHRATSILLAGHLLDVGGFRAAIERIPRLGADFVRVAPDPGFAIARGALEEAAREEPPAA